MGRVISNGIHKQETIHVVKEQICIYYTRYCRDVIFEIGMTLANQDKGSDNPSKSELKGIKNMVFIHDRT
jgi:hypothetical protein